MNYLISNGLKRHHKVLEVGCGIGTLTGLMSKYLRNGKIVATDISDESIQVAKTRIPKALIEFVVSDMQQFSYPEKFDFIVLADVLEHIPLEQHNQLFSILKQHLHEAGTIVIHIPHPKVIERLRVESPHLLQVIDQAVHAHELCANAYANSLLLVSYKAYSLYNRSHDYVFVRLSHNAAAQLDSKTKSEIRVRKFIERFKATYKAWF